MSVLDRLRKTTRGDPLRAALYARFSNDNQRNENIDAQIIFRPNFYPVKHSEDFGV